MSVSFFLSSVFAEFRIAVAAAGTGVVARRAGACIVLPVAPGFCCWPVVLLIKWRFCSSPPALATDQQLLLHWSWTWMLEAFPWTPLHHLLLLKSPSLIHHPLHQATPPFCFLPPCSNSLSLSLSDITLFLFPQLCPFLTSVGKLKRVGTLARSPERRGLGYRFGVVICFFHMQCVRAHTISEDMPFFFYCIILEQDVASSCFRTETH